MLTIYNTKYEIKMKGKNNVLREILVIVTASVLMAMVMSVGSAMICNRPFKIRQ
jgi:hypothetical protein